MNRVSRILCALLLLPLAASCSGERRYELEGQVLAVDRARGELTVRHQDIKGFMPGMTMPFKVVDQAVLTERKPGDLIRATLVVSDSLGRLDDVVRIGEAPLPPDAAEGTHPTVLDVGAMVPDASLRDQDGHPRRISDWHGKTIAVTFVYTRCPMPDFCPLMDRNFVAVQRAIRDDAPLAARVHLVSVTFDPDHDTPPVLAAHARRLGTDPAVWTWLTGSRETLEGFAKSFGISLMRNDGPAGEIVHNLRTFVIDRQGRVAQVFNGNDWRPDQLLAALRAVDAR